MQRGNIVLEILYLQSAGATLTVKTKDSTMCQIIINNIFSMLP